MANEKQKEVVVTEQDFEKGQDVEVDIVDIDLDKTYVVRKPIKGVLSKDGRQLYDYVIEGEIKKRKALVYFEPFDIRGYEAFEYIFDDDNKAEFVIKETKKTDFNSRRVTISQEYFIKDVENGFTSKIKCRAQSDKDILNMLIMIKRRNKAEQ